MIRGFFNLLEATSARIQLACGSEWKTLISIITSISRSCKEAIRDREKVGGIETNVLSGFRPPFISAFGTITGDRLNCRLHHGLAFDSNEVAAVPLFFSRTNSTFRRIILRLQWRHFSVSRVHFGSLVPVVGSRWKMHPQS